jgi:hypothetical protein
VNSRLGRIETSESAVVRELQEELVVSFGAPLGHHSFSRVAESIDIRV